MNRLANRVLLILALGPCLASFVQAGPPLSPAPRLEALAIPFDPFNPAVGQLDIDFRTDQWKDLGIVSVTAQGGVLVQNVDCPDNLSDSYGLDGFAVGFGFDGQDCDDGIEHKESITVTITSQGAGTAAFDVNGIWLTDFNQVKNGDAGEIRLYGVDGGGTREFSFSWKDVQPGDISTDPNDNDEFFVGFGETIRFTEAVISGSVGSFSVAGFAQQPIVISDGTCEDSGTGCNAEIAKNVFLELKKSTQNAGDKGVNGTLFKDGVYVIQDPRAQCQPGAAASADNQSLPIDINGDGVIDLIMQSHQCGYPEAGSASGEPVIYILDLDGSDLVIAEDTITARFDDDSNDPSVANTYFCAASDPAFRPGYGWLPKSQYSISSGYAELPVFNAAGEVVFDLQDVTTGPCGSGRGDFSRYSYVAYHWVNRVQAAGTGYDAVISARIEQLQAYVDDLFACVQQGINQSTLSSDVGRIQKSFAGGRYDQALGYVREMRLDVLDPRLNSEINAGSCFFDLAAGLYSPVDDGAEQTVPANAVGNLLVQLKHLEWMIRTTVLEEAPEEVIIP